jgi:ribosomal protein L7/L12
MDKPELSHDVAEYLFDTLTTDIESVSENSAKLRKKAMIQLGAIVHANPPPSKEEEEKWFCTMTVQDTQKWNKIGCIKLVREVANIGLADAKNFVEHDSWSLNLTLAQRTAFVQYGCVVQVKFEVGKKTTPTTTNNPPSVSRTCYLVFEEVSKTVKCFSKSPGTDNGEVAVRVDVDIPTSLFSSPKLRAKINLPEGGGVSQEMFVDLQQAIGMSYGKGVVLTLEPANGTGKNSEADMATADHQ